MGHRFQSRLYRDNRQEVEMLPVYSDDDGGWMEDWQKVPQVIGPFVPHHLEY